jgi:ATPase subunit of ABC transporter with duplicated ATPase domains
MEEQVQRILQGLGFEAEDMDRRMHEFSGGWKMRVELAKLLLQNPDLLLLDEPTNHLDIESIQWLENFLLQSSSAILLISHDRAFLDALTTRTIEITANKLFDYKASYSAYQVWREEERIRQEQAVKNQQKYIEDTEELINKFRAKKNKAAFAQSLIKKLDKLDRIEVDAADKASIRFRFPPASRSGKVVLEASGLAKSLWNGFWPVSKRWHWSARTGPGRRRSPASSWAWKKRRGTSPWDTMWTSVIMPRIKRRSSMAISRFWKPWTRWRWGISAKTCGPCSVLFCSQGRM